MKSLPKLCPVPRSAAAVPSVLPSADTVTVVAAVVSGSSAEPAMPIPPGSCQSAVIAPCGLKLTATGSTHGRKTSLPSPRSRTTTQTRWLPSVTGMVALKPWSSPASG